MRKKILYLLFFFVFLFNCWIVNAEETQTLKVLVIEINPILESIQNYDLYPNNNGHPYVSEYFGQDKDKAINELKEDLETMSHGYLKIEFVKTEYLNEFPTYNKTITLNNGNESYKYDEETYISMSRASKNSDYGNWYDFIYYPYNKPEDYSFDYGYIIEKFDLINRRNAGEFDQVWLNTIDPSGTFETMMVGKNSYWINGNPIGADCKNFMIANISISRRDANLHAYGHSAEFVLNMVFNRNAWTYGKKYNDNEDGVYDQLNLWEKFSITDTESSDHNAGVGNVHFPFNGSEDYDYDNYNSVYTYWRQWLNYPNLTGDKELGNANDWLYFEPNLALGPDEDKDPDRLYMRFWYYLMPHIEGRNEDGYYNNWWKYMTTLDYITEITQNDEFKLEVKVGNIVNPDITLNYNSGDVINVKDIEPGDNVHIIGDTIGFVDGKLKAKKVGNSVLTICYDGSCVDYNVVSYLSNGLSTSTIIIIGITVLILLVIVVYLYKNLKKKNA